MKSNVLVGSQQRSFGYGYGYGYGYCRAARVFISSVHRLSVMRRAEAPRIGVRIPNR
jgi:hypothetical protein